MTIVKGTQKWILYKLKSERKSSVKTVFEWLNKQGYYVIIALLSFLVFCAIYGIHVLNPLYTDWLVESGAEWAQHYIGWVAFRNCAWTGNRLLKRMR